MDFKKKMQYAALVEGKDAEQRAEAWSRFRRTWRAEISSRRLADMNLHVGPVISVPCVVRGRQTCVKKSSEGLQSPSHTHTHKTLTWYRILPKGNLKFIW